MSNKPRMENSDSRPNSLRPAGSVLIELLADQGVDLIFGVPGESYLAAMDGMYEHRRRVRTIMTRNEGGASFMAAAYGRLTGRPGICFVTRGPGASNACIGVHSAMQDSTPMILFIGQVERESEGREAFQEIDYGRFMGGIAKHSFEIRDPDRVAEIVARAFHLAMSGRPGPVAISLPEDMLTERTRLIELPRIEPVEPECGTKTADKILGMLNSARRPLILAGSCGWREEGCDALIRFAEQNELPVVVTFRGQDLFDNNSPCYAGDAGVGMASYVKGIIASADVVLAAGTRFSEPTTDGYRLFDIPCPKQSVVHAHPSDLELGKIFIPDMAVHSGVNSLFSALEGNILAGRENWRAWTQESRAKYLDYIDCPPTPGRFDMGVALRELMKQLPPDAILTSGAGNFAIWPSRFFVHGPESRLLGPQSGSMGYGVPAAIAAKLAMPERTVVCFSGDGDFQMTGQELSTAAQYGARPIFLVGNNGTYGTIRMHQERFYPDRVHGTDLENPDFAGWARSCGFYAETVKRTEEFANAFKRAMKSNSGALLELKLDSELIAPKVTISQLRAEAGDEK